jgi:ribosomal protein S18 acetylase RimI-like enzyme
MVLENSHRSEIIDRIVAIDRECFQFPYSRKLIESDLARSDSMLYIILEDGQIVSLQSEEDATPNFKIGEGDVLRGLFEMVKHGSLKILPRKLLNRSGTHPQPPGCSPGTPSPELSNQRAGDTLMDQSVSKIIGYAIVHLPSDARAELIRIATTTRLRRRGYSLKLLRRIVGDLEILGALSIMLEVSCTNIPAQNLYRRVGFVEIGERKRYYPDGSDALVLEHIF